MNCLARVLTCSILAMSLLAKADGHRPRLIVLTDIGGDPDDQQSLVRLLVYANEFEIEGLIALASGTPGELKAAVTKPHLIRQVVDAYAEVFPNLSKHAEGFPKPDELRAAIKSGNPHRGRGAIGDSHSTEGSRHIIEVVDREHRYPVNITIWGGQTDLAQACWDVRKERGEEGLQAFLKKVHVYDIADQDGIFEWMHDRFQFPSYVLNKAEPGRDKREAVFRGMYLGGDESLTSLDWLDAHVRKNHGPLGALYPPKTWTAPNPHSALKEGDTPSWFYFLRNGLNSYQFRHAGGGWGGRFELREGVWRDAIDTIGGKSDSRLTVSRWRPAFQNHFQARMDWCVSSVAEANHPPQARLGTGDPKNLVRGFLQRGDSMKFDASPSIDPDGDKLSYRWWVYEEASSYDGPVSFTGTWSPKLNIGIPLTAEKGGELCVILEVTDNGAPALTSYRRINVIVKTQR